MDAVPVASGSPRPRTRSSRSYRRGGGVSDMQWHDVQGVIELRGGELDVEYLRRWAPALGVAGLLQQALAEAGERR